MANPGAEGYWLGDPIAKRMQEEVLNALHLGERRRASHLLSELGGGERALQAGDFIPILQYCARTPDPLVVPLLFLAPTHSI